MQMRGLDYVPLKYLAPLIEKQIVDIFDFLLFLLHDHGISYIYIMEIIHKSYLLF